MDIEAMKRFPIEDFLARLGHHPVQRRANAVWYRSPYREEKTPSFKVNPEKNLWFDFGEGKGGNIFALAGEFIKTGDFLTQARYVAEVAGMPAQDYGPQKAVDTPPSPRARLEGGGGVAFQNPAGRPLPREGGVTSLLYTHFSPHEKRRG